MFRVGVIGTIITAICCFTPILVWLFTAIGFAHLIDYLDLTLLPLLAMFILVTIVAWFRARN